MGCWDGIQFRESVRQSFGAETSSSDWEARAVAARQMFERPEWQQMRELLWEGVVHGSSYAAQRMIRTYSDSFGTCYNANSCNAWALVAWRMGEWNLSLPTSYAPNSGQMPELSVALGHANRIWMNINTARAERGLPPLDLQLHPGFGVWEDFKRGEAERPEVYGR